jgi:hypothetical protein
VLVVGIRKLSFLSVSCEERGQKSITLSRGSDIRTKALLGSVGDVLYKTWASVLTGETADGDTDFLGLRDSDLSNMSTDERRQRVRVLFERFDTDSSGSIDEQELAVGLRDVLGFEATQQQLDQLMREVDGDGDNQIDMEELTKVTAWKCRRRTLLFPLADELCTLHPALYTLHPAPCTLHPAPCTLKLAGVLQHHE